MWNHVCVPVREPQEQHLTVALHRKRQALLYQLLHGLRKYFIRFLIICTHLCVVRYVNAKEQIIQMNGVTVIEFARLSLI